jgi:hypothetical protein
MKKLIGLFVFAMILSAGIVSLSYAAGEMAAPGGMAAPNTQRVTGDLLKIEGEFYTVHDKSGHEVRLHVDKTTKLEGGPFKTGDKLEVEATEKNHAVSVRHVQPKM